MSARLRDITNQQETSPPAECVIDPGSQLHWQGLCLVLALTCSGPGLAQDAGVLLNEQIRQQSDRERPPVVDDQAAPLAPLPSPGAESPSEGSVQVARLIFTGQSALLSQTDRQTLETLAVGQHLDIDGLQALADRTTQRLQQQGELLAYANLPPQDVTEGEITLEIRRGALSTIEVMRNENVRLREDRVEAIGQRVLKKGATRDSLTDALLRVNDLPGVSARGSLSPGATPDTSVLTVRVDETKPVSLSLSGNNYGVASTGELQGVGTLSFSNLSGYGDYSTLSYSGAEGQNYLSATAQVPIGATPFTARASYSHLDYEHTEEPGKTLQLRGETRRATMGVDYALIRTRALRVDLRGDYLQQQLEDNSLAGRVGDKDVDAWRVGVSGDLRDNLGQGGVTQLSFLVTSGELDLSALPDALAADQASLDTHGRFNTVNLNLARYQFLPHRFTLYTRLYTQWASQNLDSSQKLSLGGPYGLRGWPVAEGQGDSGLLGTVELRYQVPQLGTGNSDLQLATFVDAGRIRINKDPAGIAPANVCRCNSYSLQSAGLKLSWQNALLNIEATWARGIGDNPGRSSISGNNGDGSDDRQQFWLRATLFW